MKRKSQRVRNVLKRRNIYRKKGIMLPYIFCLSIHKNNKKIKYNKFIHILNGNSLSIQYYYFYSNLYQYPIYSFVQVPVNSENQQSSVNC